jgi:hypothetical protein
MTSKGAEDCKTPQPPHREPAGTTDEPKLRQEQHTNRQPSEIERRDWHGAGVCGDRHTD